MTALTTKPVKRVVAVDSGRVEMVVTIYPHGVLGVREKGSRHEYTISIMTCYCMAVKSEKGGK